MPPKIKGARNSKGASEGSTSRSIRVVPVVFNRRENAKRARKLDQIEGVPPEDVEVKEEQLVEVEEGEQGEDEEEEAPKEALEEEPASYGGPEDLSLLVDFKDHAAYKIWTSEGPSRGVLACRHHRHQSGGTWDPEEESEYVQKIVQRSGLMNLITYTRGWVDKPLISAFVERWYPETNTFHLPFGEMTITLHDVNRITGLPIVGKAVSGVTRQVRNKQYLIDLFRTYLGIPDAETDHMFKKTGGLSIETYWLASRRQLLQGNENNIELQQRARCLLLYVLGCTILSDKSGNKVPAKYVETVMDIERIGEYNWGSAALCFLYRQLGAASRADVKSIAGYLPMFEVWIHDYFRFRGCLRDTFRFGDPTLNRWISHAHMAEPDMATLLNLREYLDTFTAEHVDWLPLTEHYPIHNVTYYTGCLTCLDIQEAYHPGRVVRQMGRIQEIPRAPYSPVRKKRIASGAGYMVDYMHNCQYLNDWESHVLAQSQQGRVASFPGQTTSSYLPWFYGVSHPIVQNPSKRLSGRLWNATWQNHDMRASIEKSHEILRNMDSEYELDELDHQLREALRFETRKNQKINMGLWRFGT